jgi:hypothetical protein
MKNFKTGDYVLYKRVYPVHRQHLGTMVIIEDDESVYGFHKARSLRLNEVVIVLDSEVEYDKKYIFNQQLESM